jgi:predicted small lipoprotein YifL
VQRFLVVAIVVGLAACGTRTPLDPHVRRDASVDAFAESVDAFTPDSPGSDGGIPIVPDANRMDTGLACSADTSPLRGMICAQAIFGHSLNTSCISGASDVIAAGDGVLRWECNGTRAEAGFSGGVFHGTRHGHVFSLCAQPEVLHGDQCLWQSTQVIDGTLDDGHLTLHLEATPVLSDGRCDAPCMSTASVGTS